MGTVAPGIAQIGAALEKAKALKRQEYLERMYADIQRQYAATNVERMGIERSRERRLEQEAAKPKVSQWKLMGTTVVAMGQNPDGSPFVKSFPLSSEAATEMKSLEDMIGSLPADVQPMVRAMANPYIAEGDFKGAANAIKPLVQKYVTSKLPQPITESTSQTDIDPFTGKTTTKRTSQKVPAPTPSPTTVPTAKPLKPTPPPSAAAHAASIKKLAWTDVAPAPSYYDTEGKLLVPHRYWERVDEMAKALRDGATKIPTINPRNFQLWTAIMARARELGWTGGPPPTTNERDAAQWARKALPHLQETRDIIAKLDREGKLGPLAGRWNEFMAGTVGVGPEFETLRANLGLLTTALMRQHVGARGGVKLLDHFHSLWNASRMDAATLNAGLDVMESFMKSYATLDQPTTPGGTTESAPKPTTGTDPAVEQYLKSIGVK